MFERQNKPGNLVPDGKLFLFSVSIVVSLIFQKKSELCAHVIPTPWNIEYCCPLFHTLALEPTHCLSSTLYHPSGFATETLKLTWKALNVTDCMTKN